MKLNIEKIAPQLNIKINEGMGTFIGIAFKSLLNTVFDFDVYLEKYKCNLQRDYIWSEEQKSEFIISCIKGITKGITPFCLVQLSDGLDGGKIKYQVIDGKQRLLSLIGFLKGDFAIDFEGNKYFYDDLDEKCKHSLRWHGITANIAFEYFGLTDDDKLNWFKRVNFSGTPIDKKHLERFII